MPLFTLRLSEIFFDDGGTLEIIALKQLTVTSPGNRKMSSSIHRFARCLLLSLSRSWALWVLNEPTIGKNSPFRAKDGFERPCKGYVPHVIGVARGSRQKGGPQVKDLNNTLIAPSIVRNSMPDKYRLARLNSMGAPHSKT